MFLSVSPFGRALLNTRALRYGVGVNNVRLQASSSSADASMDGMATPVISWYPGHIAKAERELAEYLKKVDVVIEVRDARIPLATTHPLVPKWVGNKPLIVTFSRVDQISSKALTDWKKYYSLHPAHPGLPHGKVYFLDAKLGTGVTVVKREALKAGITVNERRIRRGIQPRAVRAAVIGYPNVGKSALINRLLGRRMAKSRNLPGVTRQLQWIRIGGIENSQEGNLELLDSPGIIPAKQVEQANAVKLAMCNDIGEASYDRVVVASLLCDHLNALYKQHHAYVKMGAIQERYKIPFIGMTGDDILYHFAETQYRGNLMSAADKLLGDFRKGYLGYGSLEGPPPGSLIDSLSPDRRQKEEQQQKVVLLGEEMEQEDEQEGEEVWREKKQKVIRSPLDVGRGDYEGW
jgi:ribosome biogenesis GTPase A